MNVFVHERKYAPERILCVNAHMQKRIDAHERIYELTHVAHERIYA